MWPNIASLRPVSAVLASITFTLTLAFSVFGQSATHNTTPPGQAPGAPAGSYELSGFDNVNLFNGHLNFSLPLMKVGGRGEADFTITLPVEQRWTVETMDSFTFYPTFHWWSASPAYGPGGMQGRQTSEGCDDTWEYTEGTTRLTFTMPDRTEYELIDQVFGGQPASSFCGGAFYDPWNGSSRGSTFVTRDGTSATFISDQAIKDVIFSTTVPYIIHPTGYLILRDGTRYRIVNGRVEWMRDRNGNKLTFTYVNSRVASITDSMNRQVTIDYDVADAQCGTCDRINFKGSGGTLRRIWIVYKELANALAPGQTLKVYGGANGLFPEFNGSSSSFHNPRQLATVILPDTRTYQFFYNSYGELAKVRLPTGGSIVYDWGPGIATAAASGAVFPHEIYRRVLERRTYTDDGTTLASITQFGRHDNPYGPADGSVWLKHLSIDGNQTVLRQSKHLFTNGPLSYIDDAPGWLSDHLEGREKQTEEFNAAGTTVLKRTVHTWANGGSLAGTPINPRVTQTVQTLEPATANLVSKRTFSYDSYNNQTDVYEYGFAVGTAGALVRRKSTTYLTTNPVNGINYATNTNIHLRSLVKDELVYDAGNVLRSWTNYEYDNYTAGTNHANLVNRSNISGLDPAFTTAYTTRGNPTATTRHFLNSSGGSTGSVSTYQQYDIAGNMVKDINGRGYITQFDFSDRYGTADSDARANSGATELGAQVSYAFATLVTNPLSHTEYTQFDFYLGRPVNTEDANGIVTSLHYSDALDRLTQVRRGIGTTAANQTTYAYDDPNRILTTLNDLNALDDGLIVGKTLFDGLGRAIETRQYEGGSNYIARQTQYDAFGRPFKTSNPFRPWQSQTPVWTTQAFDSLGRVISVTTPDGAVTATSYTSNRTKVTDPAGKARETVTDALGRLAAVYEDATSGGLNYETTYTYNVLDNLVKITQGTQQRFFMYDSLKRLIRARNPEQATNASLALTDSLTGNSAWSFAYQYDANDNLTQRTDPRGIVSTFVFDGLDRNITTDHSDTASINPDLKRFYDGATNGKGRPWYTYGGGDISTGSNVEHTAIDSYNALGKPLVQRTIFKLNGTWGPTYQISRTYNRAGYVSSQTYPSGRTVAYTYDVAGRTSSFTGNLGDGVSRTYATGITYDQWSSLAREQFGTSTAVYNKLHYNIRGQLCDVRASNVNDEWGGELGALVNYFSTAWAHCGSGTDNNGNVLMSQTIVNSFYAEDRYSYDPLNRLTQVAEYQNGSTLTGIQQYTYDRWGNRTINPASTLGLNKQFTVDTATNRLGVPGGQPGTMAYDNAGNLTTDTYTGAGNRTYDADNRMTTAADFTGQTSRYTYDADGNRTRVQVASSQEEWHVYGFDDELLAEYSANAAASAAEKEYGYRNGQLLVAATGRFNVALAANGAVATASTTATGSGFQTTYAINGNYRGPWGNSVEGWNDNTPNVVPDWIQIDFAGSKTIDEIDVFGLHDNYTQENTPTLTQTFSLYGLIAFDVQYWNGSSWVTIPGGSVTGNNKVWRKFTFSPITTSRIRVFINQVPDAWSRVVEIQAFGTSAGGEKVQWMVTDHLGTPRMMIDETGTLANVKRHDYLPFGEELFAPTGGRSAALGYKGGDGIRQQFTSKERDIETGLDYFLARYYSPTQGRFTSPDEFSGGPDELFGFGEDAADNPTFYADLTNPQSLNKYQYTYNDPLNLTDPDGHCPTCAMDPQGPRRLVNSLMNLGSKALDVVQVGLSAAGLIPGAGEAADVANAGISVARGDYTSAAIDVGGAVTGPVMSGVALGNRIRKLGKLAGKADDAPTVRPGSVESTGQVGGLGGSGKPREHFVQHNNKKSAKDSGTGRHDQPHKARTSRGQRRHFHARGRAGSNVHHQYGRARNRLRPGEAQRKRPVDRN